MKQHLPKRNNLPLVRTIIFITAVLFACISLAQTDLTREQWNQITETSPATGDNTEETTSDTISDEVPFSIGTPATEVPAENGNNNTAQDATGTTQNPADSTTQTVPTDNIPISPAVQDNFTNSVLLQGLNKITARTSSLEVKLGETVKFGNLSIILHACWKSPPEEAPESKALLEMWEEIPGETRQKIFSGWMFASSPLISAPEHPVYDITVLECTGGAVKTLESEKDRKLESEKEGKGEREKEGKRERGKIRNL